MSGQKKGQGVGEAQGCPDNSQLESDVYRYNLVLAEWKACFFWNVSCKHGISKAVYSPGRIEVSRLEDTQL